MNVGLIGYTGLTGNATLKYLMAAKFIENINVIGRRPPLMQSPNVHATIETDSSLWGRNVVNNESFISCFGLDAPSYNNQDYHDIEFNAIKSTADGAKQQGVKNFIFYSTMGADAQSRSTIFRTKGECEDYLRTLGFDRLIIFRVSMAYGSRDKPKNIAIRLASQILQWSEFIPFGIGLHSLLGDDFGKATVNILQKIHDDDFPHGETILYNKHLEAYL